MSIFYVAILLFSGLIFARIFSKIHFPEVTGFLIAGIIIGPSVLGIISEEGVKNLEIISSVALSFIAFSIGAEMKISVLKKLGEKIILITIFEALTALLVVLLGSLFIFKYDLPFSLSLASIACATAPAATLMVIRQYKAKGEMVDILLPVVALDDAVCIIAFGICSSMAVSILQGGDLSVFSMFIYPIIEILESIALGLAGGFIFALLSKKMRTDNELLSFIIAVIFMLSAVSDMLNLSGLLTLMSASVLIANLGATPRRYFDMVDRITPPIFMSFFVISGADLNLAGLKAVGAVGVFYILARALGKYLGAFTAAKISGLSKKVQNYLGLTLIPQAGVAIGLSLIASREIPDPHGAMIRTIILGATIVYELVGPLLAKFSLTKTGCIEVHKN